MIILIIIIVKKRWGHHLLSLSFSGFKVPAGFTRLPRTKAPSSVTCPADGAGATIKAKRTPPLPAPCQHGRKRSASWRGPRAPLRKCYQCCPRISARDDSSYFYSPDRVRSAQLAKRHSRNQSPLPSVFSFQSALHGNTSMERINYQAGKRMSSELDAVALIFQYRFFRL